MTSANQGLQIEYHDDAWDYFDNHGGRTRFDLPTDCDIYNDCDYVLIIPGHDVRSDNPHVDKLWETYKSRNQDVIELLLIDKLNGEPFTVVITWHG